MKGGMNLRRRRFSQRYDIRFLGKEPAAKNILLYTYSDLLLTIFFG